MGEGLAWARALDALAVLRLKLLPIPRVHAPLELQQAAHLCGLVKREPVLRTGSVLLEMWDHKMKISE